MAPAFDCFARAGSIDILKWTKKKKRTGTCPNTTETPRIHHRPWRDEEPGQRLVNTGPTCCCCSACPSLSLHCPCNCQAQQSPRLSRTWRSPLPRQTQEQKHCKQALFLSFAHGVHVTHLHENAAAQCRPLCTWCTWTSAEWPLLGQGLHVH